MWRTVSYYINQQREVDFKNSLWCGSQIAEIKVQIQYGTLVVFDGMLILHYVLCTLYVECMQQVAVSKTTKASYHIVKLICSVRDQNK